MSKKPNHKCIICGKEYWACDACDKIKGIAPWRSLADTPEHYLLYVTIRAYKGGLTTKETARKEIEKLDLSHYNDFLESAKNIIDEIMADDVAPKKAKKKSVKDKEEEVCDNSEI